MPQHTLPELSYAYDALEPFIDAQTMEIHHTKHHGGYVAKLNAALEKEPSITDRSLHDLVAQYTQLPESVRDAVRNNGGGHLNHTFFWNLLRKNEGGTPVGKTATAIAQRFGSIDAFKDAFSTAAAGRFGSGWAWLVLNTAGDLEVLSTPNQDNPTTNGHHPILGLDVWEHAYYLKYQNRRPDYITAFWNVVNWEQVEENFVQA